MNPESAAPAPIPYDPNQTQAKQHKLIRLIIILAVVGVIVTILISVFSGPPKNNELSGILANQQEMLRIIDARRESLTSNQTANFVSIVRPVIYSISRELTNAGVSVTVPIDGASIDAQLDEAVRSSRLDRELNDLLVATLKKDRLVIEQVNANTAADAKLKPILEQMLEDYSSLAEPAAE
jgi:hypothetical protein